MTAGNERDAKREPADAPHDGAGDRRIRISVRPPLGVTPPSSEATRDAANEDFLFHLYRGSELLQDNRVHEAKTELEFALSLQPRDPKGQDLLALVYFRIGLYPRAIQIYEELLREAVDEPSLKLNLALCYLKTGQAERARTELEAVVQLNPEHRRAWGYLGLAYQRTGEFLKAQHAFDRGGHSAMSKRMSDRAITVPPPQTLGVTYHPPPGAAPLFPPPTESSRERGAEIRAFAATAFEELDSGELSFALAEPEASTAEAGTWHAVEPGAAARVPPKPPSTSASSVPHQHRHETLAWGFRTDAKAEAQRGEHEANLEPPSDRLGDGPKPTVARKGDRAPRPVAALAEDARLAFPAAGVAVLESGLVLVRTRPGGRESEFAVRLEAVRSYSGAFATGVLQRQTRGQITQETFGGVTTPMATISGEADLVLGPRPAHRIIGFALREGDVAFLREELLLGFEMKLSYENGRLAVGDGGLASMVQLRGAGTALAELLHPLAALEVTSPRAVHIRREALVGWIGRLVPRELPLGEAPGGQHGLVSFSGDGTILLAAW